MTYQVKLTPEAADSLRQLDKIIAQRIMARIRWLSENVDAITAEPLSGEMKGLFKFRVGSYRVVYTTLQKDRLIIIHLIGHRRNIYKAR